MNKVLVTSKRTAGPIYSEVEDKNLLCKNGRLCGKRIEVYVDGGCQPNPGIATYGFVVFSERRRVYGEGGVLSEDSTSNMAEYGALVQALMFLVEANVSVQPVCIYSDSRLMVEQVSRSWNCRSENLVHLRDLAWWWLAWLPNAKLCHIPRRLNMEADRLSTKAREGFLTSERKK